MSADQTHAAYAAGTQTLEPDAAYARLAGTMANLRAEDLPAFRTALNAERSVNRALDRLLRALLGQRRGWQRIADVSLSLAVILLAASVALFMREALGGYDFTTDEHGRILFYCQIAGLGVLAFAIGLAVKALLWLTAGHLARQLEEARETAARQLRDIRAARSAGIGHSLARIGIGEAGLSLRSNTRHLKLRWNTFDPAATRQQSHGAAPLPAVPDTLRMPVSLATLDACQAHAGWRGFSQAVEEWAQRHDRLVLVMHRNLEAEKEFMPVGDRPPPGSDPRNWRKPRYVERDFEDWEETLPVHRRFFESEDSDLSWAQFVFFTLALIHSRAQPPESLREGPPDLHAG